MPRAIAPCGTDGGYYRHRRTTKTPVCDACLAAHATEDRRRRAARAGRPTPPAKKRRRRTYYWTLDRPWGHVIEDAVDELRDLGITEGEWGIENGHLAFTTIQPQGKPKPAPKPEIQWERKGLIWVARKQEQHAAKQLGVRPAAIEKAVERVRRVA